MSDDLVEGLTGSDPCQDVGGEPPFEPFDCFADDDRGDDKSRLIKFLTYHPESVPIARCVKAVMPSGDADRIAEREYSNTDYQFARRFLDRTEYAELDDSGDVLSASPTPAAFHLTRESKIPTEAAPGFAKDRAEALTRGIWSLNDVKNARLLAKDFSMYLESIDDRRLMLEEPDHNVRMTMPYHTRFNNEHRKKEQWARYNTAWEMADAKYRRGVMLTLTTDPKRFDSIAAMVDGLMEAWQDLLETLNQRYGDGDRLDFIRALEFGGSDKSNHVGLPHLHVCVFGVPYVDHGWLKSYWSTRQGEIVHIHGMNKRGSDSWVMQTGVHKGKSAAGYLGKYLSKAFESIGDGPDELFAELNSWEEGGSWASSELWKLALYWATGRQFWSCSHDLKDDRADPDRLEDVPGLGEKKLDRLADAGIRTLSDVRLADRADLVAIESISENFVDDLLEIVGEPSEFDLYSFDFVGAAKWSEIPSNWSTGAKHFGVPVT